MRRSDCRIDSSALKRAWMLTGISANFDRSRYRRNTGTAIAARTPMSPITITSSMRVNPFATFILRHLRATCFPPVNVEGRGCGQDRKIGQEGANSQVNTGISDLSSSPFPGLEPEDVPEPPVDAR